MGLIHQYAIKTADMLKDDSRFYRFESGTKILFFDGLSYAIKSIDKKYKPLIENPEGIDPNKVYETEELKSFLQILKTINEWKESENLKYNFNPACNIMMNLSNKCNLDCVYCYRDKTAKDKSDSKVAEEIVEFAIHKYLPHAKEYVITYNMTSEPLLEKESMETLLDNYHKFEDYSFAPEDFIDITPIDFLSRISETVHGNVNKETTDALANAKLNTLLQRRTLLDELSFSPDLLDGHAAEQYGKKDHLLDYKIRRLNRWALEAMFPKQLRRKENPFVGFWFMSNGTKIGRKEVDFIKACDINPFWISIDGPEEVHNRNRRYKSGAGSYKEIVDSVNFLIKNDIPLKASAVMTKDFPNPLEIALHLKELGFRHAQIVPVRPGTEYSFTKENVQHLLDNYTNFYVRLSEGALNGDFSLFNFLKEDLSMKFFEMYYYRKRLFKRCPWGEQLVINRDGDVFPCLYLINNKDFLMGSIYSEKREGLYPSFQELLVFKRPGCKDCWARFLCGGTCFYGSYVKTGDIAEREEVECMISKHCAAKTIEMIAKLQEAHISLKNVYT